MESKSSKQKLSISLTEVSKLHRSALDVCESLVLPLVTKVHDAADPSVEHGYLLVLVLQ